MILIRYDVVPRPEHPEFQKSGAAFACVFVDSDDPEKAKKTAVEYLEQEAFEVLKMVRIDPLRKDADFLAHEDTRIWLEAARRHGVYAWIQCVPKEAYNPDPLS